ncbi:hypothetical protein OCS_02777 [Ophiocordyceps sinensis CO18]|uniref:Uncharacterized protein n=1 Tax=Ophiocordyceps sinensis (strain Co18 / CGMCC 3.14243) TaxID=911162 RepID=T5AIC2_OPHSC|nr:hypothetical protein OCS_02777 [Ophiocordyceps sinensis CO18]
MEARDQASSMAYYRAAINRDFPPYYYTLDSRRWHEGLARSAARQARDWYRVATDVDLAVKIAASLE